MKGLIGLAAVIVVAVGAVASVEGAFFLVFGWIPFMGRVGPAVSPDGPTVWVALSALLLFAAGVHWIGRSRRGGAGRWTVRSTAAVVSGVIVLFAAGIAMVGIVHQVGWLAAREQPLRGPGLARQSTQDTQLRYLHLGLANYSSTENQLPPGGTFAQSGEMLHSWETHLLPYLVYDSRSIDRQRPWNDPVNRSYFRCVVPEFINPGFRTPPLEDAKGYGLSHYAANGHVMGANTAFRMEDLKIGAANTILAGEVNAGFRPWGHPVNWRDPAAGVGNSPRSFGGPPGAGGARFLMADGSVRFFGDRTDPQVLRSLCGTAREAATR